MRYSFNALGTTWWIELFDELTEQQRNEITDFITLFVSTYESNYSRFKSDSLISELNRSRTISNPTTELVQLLTYGKQLYLRSYTVFNFLTGHILEARGYDAAYSFIDRTDPAVRPGNPITDLTITPTQIDVHGGNIDIGGFGKGYLIDLLVTELQRTFNVEQLLINGGGDIYATHHNNEPIHIYLEHPTKPGIGIMQTTLLNQGFAASSPHKRSWRTSKGTLNHIVSCSIVADGVFVKAATAADADAFATTILQLPAHQTKELAQTEHLAVAQFNVETARLTSTRNF